MAKVRIEHYLPGEVVFNEGDPSHYLYVVKEGLIRLERANQGHVISLGKNNVFGEMGFLDREPRSAAAVAEVASELYIFDHKSLDIELDKLPSWCKKVLHLVIQRLRDTNEKLQPVNFEDEQLRVVHFMQLVMHQFSKEGSPAIKIPKVWLNNETQTLLQIQAVILEEVLSKMAALFVIDEGVNLVTIENTDLFKSYYNYLKINNTFRKRLDDNGKYSNLPARVIQLVTALIEPIRQQDFARTQRGYLYLKEQRGEVFSRELAVKDEDISLLVSYSVFSEDTDDTYLINEEVVEGIALSQEKSERLDSLITERFVDFLKALKENYTESLLSLSMFKQSYIMIRNQPMGDHEIHFFKLLGLLLPTEHYDEYKLSLKTVSDLLKFIELHQRFFEIS